MQNLIELVDFKLGILIIISSYWVKSNFKHCFKKIPLSLKIFIWSTIMSFAYYFIGKYTGLFDAGNLIDLLITYFAATSFYELFFKPLENFIKSKTQEKK